MAQPEEHDCYSMALRAPRGPSGSQEISWGSASLVDAIMDVAGKVRVVIGAMRSHLRKRRSKTQRDIGDVYRGKRQRYPFFPSYY